MFDNIDDVIPRAERDEFMAGYRAAAGFAVEQLNTAPPIIAHGTRVRSAAPRRVTGRCRQVSQRERQLQIFSVHHVAVIEQNGVDAASVSASRDSKAARVAASILHCGSASGRNIAMKVAL